MRALVWFVVGLGACAGGETADTNGSDDTALIDDAACTGAFEQLVANEPIATSDDAFRVAWVDVDPTRPAKGENRWSLSVTDASGVPVAGASVVVTPFMSVHGHGLSPADYVGDESTTAIGVYEVTPFNLSMPGTWEFTVTIVDGATTDALELALCVQG